MPTPAPPSLSQTNVALTGLARDLARRAEAGAPVRIGLIGAGQMGADVVSRVAHMTGVVVGAICDRRGVGGRRAIAIAYGDDALAREATTPDAVNAAIEAGRIAITPDAYAMMDAGLIDVVLDATGVPEAGAELGFAALQRGKHLVMMNVEADVCIGPYLRHEADKRGLVYTLGAGDEPSSCIEIIEFIAAMGHRVVCAGKGKNNPLNVDATPDAYEAEARARNMNPRMLVEFVDGSKTMVEMAAIANATGLSPDIPGMHGPAAGPDDLATTLIPQADGGVLSGAGRVDFSVGKGVAPGVFVVAEMAHPRIRERVTDLKVGDGPYYTFIRPYHLTSLEAPLSCARAVLYGRADMAPLPHPVAEVCALAKRDIAAGESLGQVGEYDYRAWIMTAADARSAGALPCGLLAGGRATAAIPKGALITTANAAPPPDSAIVKMRARLDAMRAEGEFS